MKGAIDTAEERTLKSFGEQISLLRMGEEYTWEIQDATKGLRERHGPVDFCRTRHSPWSLSISSIALQQATAPFEEVLPVLRARPSMQACRDHGQGGAFLKKRTW